MPLGGKAKVPAEEQVDIIWKRLLPKDTLKECLKGNKPKIGGK